MKPIQTHEPYDLRDAWGLWLGNVRWDHWITGTFSPDRFPNGLNLATALHRFRDFVNALGGRLKRSIPWFATAEQAHDGPPHVHGVTAESAGLDLSAIRSRWRSRNARIVEVEEYDPELGATHYMTKLAATDEFTWDCSRAAEDMLRSAA